MNHRCQWRSSSKSNSSQYIHDKIEPNKLCGLERWLSQVNGSTYQSNDTCNVTSHLELEELLNIRIDVFTPHQTSNDRYELVVNKNKSGSLSRDRFARSHSKRTISLLQTWKVIEAVTNNTDLSSFLKFLSFAIQLIRTLHILETNRDHELIFWIRACNNLYGLEHFIKPFLIFKSVRNRKRTVCFFLKSSNLFPQLPCINHKVLLNLLLLLYIFYFFFFQLLGSGSLSPSQLLI